MSSGTIAAVILSVIVVMAGIVAAILAEARLLEPRRSDSVPNSIVRPRDPETG